MWLLQIINKSPLDDIQRSIESTIKDAKAKFDDDFQGEYPKGGLGISTLRPFHVQDGTTYPDAVVNNWRTTIGTAETWEDWINVTLNRNLFIICSGLFNRTLNPALLEIWFKASGRDTAVQNIEQMYTWEECFAYWSKPFQVGPEKKLESQLYGKVAQVELMGLLGFTVGRTEILIDKS